MSAIRVSELQPVDLLSIEIQRAQHFTFGLPTRSATREEAEDLAAEVEAWAIRDLDDRLIACFGIQEKFPDRHGVAWATLAEGIGRAHLEMTRFARSRVLGCGLQRVEAIVRAADAENVIASFPFLSADREGLFEAMLAMPTPEMTWARLCGLQPAHVLRKFGAAGETYMLCERIG